MQVAIALSTVNHHQEESTLRPIDAVKSELTHQTSQKEGEEVDK